MDEGPPADPGMIAPRDEIRIRDASARARVCSVCGRAKPAHIEIVVDGVAEYTCRECYEGEVVELTACRSCGAALERGDGFCGKCGAPSVRACGSCGADLHEEDRYCGKCGADVR